MVAEDCKGVGLKVLKLVAIYALLIQLPHETTVAERLNLRTEYNYTIYNIFHHLRHYCCVLVKL